jgi:hypothetical protein
MNRNSGIGLSSGGVILVVVGAILRFATSVETSGFNIHKIGDILLLAGVVLIILSVIFVTVDARSRSRMRTEIRHTGGGSRRGDQDWGTY